MSEARDHVTIHGTERHPLPGTRKVGVPDPGERIPDVTVLLRRRPSSEGLNSVLADMESKLPQERSYFSREELEAEHGADPDDAARVKAFAREHNLNVEGEDLARRTVWLSGTVDALGAAFGAEFAEYEGPEGKYRGRTGSLTVPAELRDIVENVSGLDNRPVAYPHFRDRPLQPHAGGLSHTPPEVAKLYNFPTGVDGTGQTIGIIELGGGFDAKDLKKYFGQLGIPEPNVTAVSIAGGRNTPGINRNADGEVMLDIEVAGAVAPGARIVVYFAPNRGNGFINAVTAAIHDRVNKPSVISISWGAHEKGQTLASMRSFEQALQDAAALGVTVCCASGDDGSSDIRAGIEAPDGLAHADHPASCPHALACGGTQLVSSGGTISSETVWNDPGGGATGGGVSDVFDLPDYQKGINVHSVNPGGRVGRIVPDVAGDAAPGTGYQVLVDGQPMVIGGTSAVAPLWAGYLALVNQSLGKPVGFINPLLYRIAASNGKAFHDITKGSNAKNALGYQARQGYDACTGLGSPDGANLLKALTQPVASVQT